MAKTAVIFGKSAAVVIAINDVPSSESARTAMRIAWAQNGVEASSKKSSSLDASRFRAAGFTAKEIDEIGFALLGCLKASHDA